MVSTRLHVSSIVLHNRPSECTEYEIVPSTAERRHVNYIRGFLQSRNTLDSGLIYRVRDDWAWRLTLIVKPCKRTKKGYDQLRIARHSTHNLAPKVLHIDLEHQLRSAFSRLGISNGRRTRDLKTMKKCVSSWVSTASHASHRSLAQYTHLNHSPLMRSMQRSHTAELFVTSRRYSVIWCKIVCPIS